jgi:hypothetical protein
MASSGMLQPLALIRTDVSEELSTSFIRMTRIGELGTTLACHPDEGGAKFFRNSVITRATRRNISEDTILHSHRLENLKSYIVQSDVNAICLVCSPKQNKCCFI